MYNTYLTNLTWIVFTIWHCNAQLYIITDFLSASTLHRMLLLLTSLTSSTSQYLGTSYRYRVLCQYHRYRHNIIKKHEINIHSKLFIMFIVMLYTMNYICTFKDKFLKGCWLANLTYRATPKIFETISEAINYDLF